MSKFVVLPGGITLMGSRINWRELVQVPFVPSHVFDCFRYTPRRPQEIWPVPGYQNRPYSVYCCVFESHNVTFGESRPWSLPVIASIVATLLQFTPLEDVI